MVQQTVKATGDVTKIAVRICKEQLGRQKESAQASETKESKRKDIVGRTSRVKFTGPVSVFQESECIRVQAKQNKSTVLPWIYNIRKF